jgi:hypothetical protein
MQEAGDQAAFADTDKFVYDNNYWMYNSLWEVWYQIFTNNHTN